MMAGYNLGYAGYAVYARYAGWLCLLAIFLMLTGYADNAGWLC